jgi:hypothetical protein
VPETDSYGSVKRVVPWRDFVVGQLVRGDSYGRRAKLDDIAKESVEAMLKGQLAGLLTELATKVRDQVDELLGAKIKEAVRTAAGIK